MTDYNNTFPLTFTEIAKEKLAAALADEGEGFFIRVAVKGGGCVHPNQEIAMYDGTYIKAKNLKIGDTLVSCSGKPTKITKIHTTNVQNQALLNLRGSCGKSHNVILTPDHRVFVNGNDFVPAKNISSCENTYSEKRDFLTICFPSDIIDVPDLTLDLCKIFGYYLAEGCISYRFNKYRTRIKSKRVEFSCGKHEKRLIKHIQSLLLLLGYKSSLREKTTSLYLTAYSTKLANLVERYCGNNTDLFLQSKEKRLHQDIILLPHAKQKALLKYYLSGDGCRRRTSSGSLEIRSCSTIYQLSRQIETITARTGYFTSFQKSNKPSLCFIEDRLCNQAQSYEISYKKNVSHYKYRPVSGGFMIKAKEKPSFLYSGQLIDFSCYPHEAYAAGGIIIHNCSGWQHSLELDNEQDPEEDIEISLASKNLPIDGQPAPKSTKVITDAMSALYLDGIELDYITEGFTEGFKFIDKVGKIKSHCACGSSVRY